MTGEGRLRVAAAGGASQAPRSQVRSRLLGTLSPASVTAPGCWAPPRAAPRPWAPRPCSTARVPRGGHSPPPASIWSADRAEGPSRCSEAPVGPPRRCPLRVDPPLRARGARVFRQVPWCRFQPDRVPQLCCPLSTEAAHGRGSGQTWLRWRTRASARERGRGAPRPPRLNSAWAAASQACSLQPVPGTWGLVSQPALARGPDSSLELNASWPRRSWATC